MAIGLASRTAGDVLVVDTIGLNDKTWLNGQGVPQQRSVARHRTLHASRPWSFERRDTLEDSKAFTKPHTFTRTYTFLPNWEIHEYVCNEFNVDAEHLVGK
jgi:hypothetical protein